MEHYKPLLTGKITIHGDANITDDAGAIKEIMNHSFDISAKHTQEVSHL